MSGQYIQSSSTSNNTTFVGNQNNDYSKVAKTNTYNNNGILPNFYFKYKVRKGDTWISIKKRWSLGKRADKYVKGLPKVYRHTNELEVGIIIQIPYWYNEKERKDDGTIKPIKSVSTQKGNGGSKISFHEFIELSDKIRSEKRQKESFGKANKIKIINAKHSNVNLASPPTSETLPFKQGEYFKLKNNLNYYNTYSNLAKTPFFTDTKKFFPNWKETLAKEAEQGAKKETNRLNNLNEDGTSFFPNESFQKQFEGNYKEKYKIDNKFKRLHDLPYKGLESMGADFIYLIVPLSKEFNVDLDKIINSLNPEVWHKEVAKTQRSDLLAFLITGETIVGALAITGLTYQLIEDNRKNTSDKRVSWDGLTGVVNGILTAIPPLTKKTGKVDGMLSSKDWLESSLKVKLLEKELTGVNVKFGLENFKGSKIDETSRKILEKNKQDGKQIWLVTETNEYYDTYALREKINKNASYKDYHAIDVTDDSPFDSEKTSEEISKDETIKNISIFEEKNLKGYPYFKKKFEFSATLGNYEPRTKLASGGSISIESTNQIDEKTSFSVKIKGSSSYNLFQQGESDLDRSKNENLRLDKLVVTPEIGVNAKTNIGKNTSFSFDFGAKMEIISQQKYNKQRGSLTSSFSLSHKNKHGVKYDFSTGYAYTPFKKDKNTVFFKLSVKGKNITMFGSFDLIKGTSKINFISYFNRPNHNKPKKILPQ